MFFRRLRDRRAYGAAVRVLNHAALTRFRDRPLEAITALEALDHWHESRSGRHGPATPGVGHARPTTAPIWGRPGGDADPIPRRVDVATPAEYDEMIAVEPGPGARGR